MKKGFTDVIDYCWADEPKHADGVCCWCDYLRQSEWKDHIAQHFSERLTE